MHRQGTDIPLWAPPCPLKSISTESPLQITSLKVSTSTLLEAFHPAIRSFNTQHPPNITLTMTTVRNYMSTMNTCTITTQMAGCKLSSNLFNSNYRQTVKPPISCSWYLFPPPLYLIVALRANSTPHSHAPRLRKPIP